MPSHDFCMAAAYDAVAETYLLHRNKFSNEKHLADIAGFLPAGARVLDLGCGAGEPVSLYLSTAGFEVHGIDISPKQIELARQRVPRGEFRVGDVAALNRFSYEVDCVVAFYAIYHIPRRVHARLYSVLRSFLPEGGLFFALLGTKDWEGAKEDFYGGEMRWSSYDVETEVDLIRDAGFNIISAIPDSAGGESHVAVTAQARAD